MTGTRRRTMSRRRTLTAAWPRVLLGTALDAAIVTGPLVAAALLSAAGAAHEATSLMMLLGAGTAWWTAVLIVREGRAIGWTLFGLRLVSVVDDSPPGALRLLPLARLRLSDTRRGHDPLAIPGTRTTAAASGGRHGPR